MRQWERKMEKCRVGIIIRLVLADAGTKMTDKTRGMFVFVIPFTVRLSRAVLV
jgi:hypothetical protein